MENHPIPQDVTGFQFRLIGDMTVKQFAYLAGGAVGAWVFWAVLPLAGFLKFPISAGVAGLGAALAFLPVSGRPLDLMLTNFLKALFVPSQYVYQKTGSQFSFDMIQAAPHPAKQKAVQDPAQASQAPQKNLTAYLQTISHNNSQNPLDQKEQAYLQTISAGFSQPGTPAPSAAAFAKADQVITPAAKPVAHQIQQPPQTQPIAEIKPAAPIPKPAPVDIPEQPTSQPAPPQPQTDVQSPVVRKMAPNEIPQKRQPTLPAPEIPNLVMGIVKDSRGNILPNILVEIKDKEGNPIRAFKTNQLGQFASATPLLPGTYTMVLEDPKAANKFDPLELPINGTIIPPLEITSTDAREELRKALFTQ